MALISLGLSTVKGPPLQVRSDQWGGLLTPTEGAILTGGAYGTWSPGVLNACVNRLSGVLNAGDVDPSLLGLVPWIARQLVEGGEVVMLLDDNLLLRPVSAYELTGSSAGRTYRTVTVSGPDRSSEYRNVSPSQVIHSVIRPVPTSPWRGQHWRQTAGIVADQLRSVDQAIQQESGQPRGSLLPTVAAESPERVRKLLASLLRLRGGLSSYPLIGRQGESPGPSPQPIRLQTCSLPELLRAREDLSASLAESLGFSRVTLGLGTAGQVSRPDGIRTWIATTASAWVNTIRNELERVLERPIVLDLEPVLAGLVPIGLRVGAAARLHAAGWSQEAAERLVRLA